MGIILFKAQTLYIATGKKSSDDLFIQNLINLLLFCYQLLLLSYFNKVRSLLYDSCQFYTECNVTSSSQYNAISTHNAMLSLSTMQCYLKRQYNATRISTHNAMSRWCVLQRIIVQAEQPQRVVYFIKLCIHMINFVP